MNIHACAWTYLHAIVQVLFKALALITCATHVDLEELLLNVSCELTAVMQQVFWPGSHSHVPTPGRHLPISRRAAPHACGLQPQCSAHVAKAGGSRVVPGEEWSRIVASATLPIWSPRVISVSTRCLLPQLLTLTCDMP